MEPIEMGGGTPLLDLTEIRFTSVIKVSGRQCAVFMDRKGKSFVLRTGETIQQGLEKMYGQ
jgi:hypothetical protein